MSAVHGKHWQSSLLSAKAIACNLSGLRLELEQLQARLSNPLLRQPAPFEF